MNIVMFYMWLFLFGLHIVKAHRFSSPTHREYLNSWFLGKLEKKESSENHPLYEKKSSTYFLQCVPFNPYSILFRRNQVFK